MSEKLTELERAKRKTLDKLERIIRVITGGPLGSLGHLWVRRMWGERITCGFCWEYKRWDCCTACPIFLAEGRRECYRVESYSDIYGKLGDAHPDTVTDLLAVMVYVHQLEAPDG